MKFSDKLLSLVIALSMIIALALIAMIFRDLNDLWSALIDYQQIIKSQNDKIRDLQLLVISKIKYRNRNMIRESDAAYIAGLFDGEGSIEFKKRKEKKRYWNLQLHANQYGDIHD